MKILIATDGSDFSKAAVHEYCRNFAKPETDKVLIVSVYDETLPISSIPIMTTPEYYQAFADDLKAVAETNIKEAREIISTHFPSWHDSIESEVIRGVPDQQVIDKAKRWKANLIVVGSHGRGFWGRLLGSVSTGVVHHAPCSVLVVREKGD